MIGKKILLFVTVFMLAFIGCAAAETAEPAPEPTPEPQKVELLVNGYELTFDDVMQPNISFQLPQDELSIKENAVVFYLLADETQHPLFTMYIHSDDGNTHTVLRSETGDIVPISFVFAPVPQDFTDDELQLFKLDAEEAVNMLIATLQLHQLPNGQQNSVLDESVQLDLLDYQLSYTTQQNTRLQITVEGNRTHFLLPLADGTHVPVFMLECGSAEGNIVVVVQGIPVAFTMQPLPEQLDSQNQNLFYRAQELVNDVISTLKVTQTAE